MDKCQLSLISETQVSLRVTVSTNKVDHSEELSPRWTSGLHTTCTYTYVYAKKEKATYTLLLGGISRQQEPTLERMVAAKQDCNRK